MRESLRIFGRDVSTARLYAFPTCVSITGIGIAMADVGEVAAPEFGFQNGLSIGGRGDNPHFKGLKGLQCSFRVIRLLATGDEQEEIHLLAPVSLGDNAEGDIYKIKSKAPDIAENKHRWEEVREGQGW